MSKIIESVVRLFEDPSSQVSREAISVAKEIVSKTTCFDKMIKKLSPYIRNNLEKGIEDHPQEKETKPKSNLAFGVISNELMGQFMPSENWRIKVSAAEQLETIISSHTHLEDLLPNISEFMEFINKLLTETNFKIVVSALNIIEHLSRNSFLGTKSHLDLVIPSCIAKLGDNKIAIRQLAFKIVSCILEKVKSRDIFPYLIKDLYNSNWHIREEVVTIIIAAMLRSVSFNYLQLIPHLAKLLDDEKTKVRHVTTECLAVLSSICGEDAVIQGLEPIIDSVALKCLSERFRHPTLPNLVENVVQFPRTVPSSAPTISSPYITSSPFPNPQDPKDFKMYNNIMSNDMHSLGFLTPSLQLERSSDPLAREAARKRTSRNESRLFLIKNEQRPGFMKPPTIPVNMNTRAAGIQFTSNHGKSKGRESPSLANLLTPSGSPTKQIDIQFSDSVSPFKRPEETEQVYLAEFELKPVANPNESLSSCMSVADDWAAQFEAVNILRRLTKHHSEALCSSGILHQLISQAVNWAYSLRSSLCKNSLILFGEMCQSIPSYMENELKLVVSCLMRKSSDSNSFISDQATESLIAMAKNCNVSKTMSALVNFAAASKATLVKSKTSLCFQLIFERSRENIAKLKDLDRSIQLLVSYVYDASSTVRAASKDALFALGSELDRLLMRCLSDDDYKRAKEQLERKRGRTPKRILKSAEPGYHHEARTPSESRSFRVRNSPAKVKLASITPEPNYSGGYSRARAFKINQ